MHRRMKRNFSGKTKAYIPPPSLRLQAKGNNERGKTATYDTVEAAENRDKVTDLVRVKGMNPEHMCVATT